MSVNTVEPKTTPNLPANILTDVQTVSSIPILPTLLEVICRTTGMGFAAVARVTEDRWVACSVKDDIQFGLKPGEELKVETTICHEIRQGGGPVLIDNVAENPEFANHHTPALYGFQSYISVPIYRKDGRFFGTLCAIDPHPHKIETPEIKGMFTLFADLISFHLDSIEKLTSSESKLQKEIETGSFRDEFIAILGHDLKNPVSAISNGAQILQRMQLDPQALRLAQIIKNSAYRMSELIENILDFARGRLGEGISINPELVTSPESFLLQVINELKAVWPDREIITSIDLPLPLHCDAGRLGQLLSNLLGNALTYGSNDQPVQVTARIHAGNFVLAVTNAGPAISRETMRRLFEPFARGEVRQGQQGLGLGLYIAYKIALGHGGDIEVESKDGFTCFTFRMPLDPRND